MLGSSLKHTISSSCVVAVLDDDVAEVVPARGLPPRHCVPQGFNRVTQGYFLHLM